MRATICRTARVSKRAGAARARDDLLIGSVDVLVGSVDVLVGSVDVLVRSVDVLIGNVDVLVGSVDVLIGNVDVLIGSVDVLVGSVDVLVGSVDVLVGSVEVLVGSDEVLVGSDDVVVYDGDLLFGFVGQTATEVDAADQPEAPNVLHSPTKNRHLEGTGNSSPAYDVRTHPAAGALRRRWIHGHALLGRERAGDRGHGVDGDLRRHAGRCGRGGSPSRRG